MKKENVKKLTEKNINKENNPIIKRKIEEAFANTNIGAQNIYGIYDRLYGFSQVFIEKNDGIVCRNVKAAVDAAKKNNQMSPLADCPEQFDIMELVTIDNDKKIVTPKMRLIMNVKDLLDMTN